jgi:hypothetical protein
MSVVFRIFLGLALLMATAGCISAPAGSPTPQPSHTPAAVAPTNPPPTPYPLPGVWTPTAPIPYVPPATVPPPTPRPFPLPVVLIPTETITSASAIRIRDLSFIDPDNGWLLAYNCRQTDCPLEVRATKDGGRTWETRAAQQTNAGFLPQPSWTGSGDSGVSAIEFINPNDGWLYSPDFYSTHDGGRTWTDEKRKVYQILPDGPAIWIIENIDGHLLIERSLDNGRTWSPIRDQPEINEYDFLASNQTDTVWLVLRGYDAFDTFGIRLLSSSDQGASWQTLATPVSLCVRYGLAAVGGGNLWLLCDEGAPSYPAPNHVHFSADGGHSWELRADSSQGVGSLGIFYPSFLQSPRDFVAVTERKAFIALDGDTLEMTVNGGRDWGDAIPYDLAKGDFDTVSGLVRFIDARTGWFASGRDRLFRTVDGGHTWEMIFVP